jgi:hypothetical protein
MVIKDRKLFKSKKDIDKNIDKEGEENTPEEEEIKIS